MSRLDSFIRRMSAQRDILNALATRLSGVPGPVFEFGLGSGRTYDHLLELFPSRRIIVFEDVVLDRPLSRPDRSDVVAGHIRETASNFVDGSAAMIHVDIETGVGAVDAELAHWLPALVARLLAPGGYAASGCALKDPRLMDLELPPSVDVGRYHMVQRVSTASSAAAAGSTS